MSNILNQPVEKKGLLWLIDNFRFYEKIDGSKRQIMISGWIFDKENPAEDVEVTVSAGSAKVEIERMPRKDVCDMYDIAAENVGFRILIEAEAFDFNVGNILVTAKEELLSIDQELLDAHKVDNVHHMIDQFAMNGNVIRMAGGAISVISTKSIVHLPYGLRRTSRMESYLPTWARIRSLRTAST